MGQDLGRATSTLPSHDGTEVIGTVSMTYEARILRRRRLNTDQGASFIVDLSETTNLIDGAVFVLEGGQSIRVKSADEALIEVRGAELARLAWHVGNRHTPCQISSDRLWIQQDHVLKAMLEQLGASVTDVTRPFNPEGGAYGHGRTYGHTHADDHEHSHV
ncbi:MAG: urease accessory protein UreE [Pseudoruegeria sp.]